MDSSHIGSHHGITGGKPTIGIPSWAHSGLFSIQRVVHRLLLMSLMSHLHLLTTSMIPTLEETMCPIREMPRLTVQHRSYLFPRSLKTTFQIPVFSPDSDAIRSTT